MMNYDYLHEVEAIRLRSPLKRHVSELLPLFERRGFVLHDDVLSLDRKGKVPPWQHSSIVEVEVICDHVEVFGFDEGEWDQICLKYLFASLPYEFVDKFIKIAFELNKELGTILDFQGSDVTADEIKRRFDGIRKELILATGEDVGSERLAILIHSTYPRR